MVDLFVTLSTWDSIMAGIRADAAAVLGQSPGLIVFFHWLFTPLLGADSGWTWTLSIVMLTVTIRTIAVREADQLRARHADAVRQAGRAAEEVPGHDRERLGQETMKLYKEEGVNPMASCLPLLLQMPIFISLFRVLEGVASGHVRGHFFKVNPHLVDSLNNATIFGARL